MESALCPVLIGREAELSKLEDSLLAANRGDGQVVVLAGDAGMGKTRLATELMRRARHLGTTVLSGACSEAELQLPYLPFLEAIGNHLAGADVEELRTQLGLVRRELAHLFPQLEPEGVNPDVDSSQGRLRLYEAVLALLSLLAHGNGLLLVIEDLHWADASTRELLDYLVRRLRNDRIMILATHRSDEIHRRHPLLPLIQGWRRNSTATIVELEPLTPGKVADMVIAIFDIGAEGVQEDTRDFLHSRTEGNPFVLEEMLKAALDRGDIFRNDSGWTRKALEDFRLPASVRDTILLRLDRLSPQEIDILRAAAVLGTDFSYQTLLAIAGHPEADVRAAIATFVMQQLLSDRSGRTGARYRFRHALTREAIYDDIIVPLRERLHGLAADVLQAANAGPLEVSHHLLAARRTDEAVPLCLTAAKTAEAEYAHSDAAQLYERVLEYVTDDRRRGTTLCRLGTAYQSVGQPSAAREYLESGIAILDRLGEAQEAAHFRLRLGRVAWESGRSADALPAIEQARVALEPQGSTADLALAYVLLASLRLFQLDGHGALALAQRALTIAGEAGAGDVAVLARLYLGGALAYVGDKPEESLEMHDSCFKEAVERNLLSVATIAFNNSAQGLIFDYRSAEVLERLPMLDQLPDSYWKSLVWSKEEGEASLEQGDMRRALSAFRTMGRLARAANNRVSIHRSNHYSAHCHFELDEPNEARAVIPQRSELAEISMDDVLFFDVMAIRHSLASGDAGAAAEAASIIFGEPIVEPNNRSKLATWAAWAFLAADQLEMAGKAAEIGLGDGVGVRTPSKTALHAVIAQLNGDLQEAVATTRLGLNFLDAAGCHFHASPMRRRLADLLLLQGDQKSARIELQTVFDTASSLDMLLEKRLAREALRELGVELTDDPSPTSSWTGPTGERWVTVLFLDVRGYTAIAREKAAPELAETMATLQRWASVEVEKHQGIIDKFAGDAVMATFNVSGAHVDHASHALSCALAIRDKASALGLPTGAGIATGSAVVGSLSERANLSVVGETTNLASRLQGQAGAGEILLSAESYRRVRDWLSGHGYQANRDALELKGIARPIEAWRVGLRGVEAPAPATADDSLPLTKREREVAVLVAAGLTNKQIATRLFRSERVIDNHVQHCFVKLGIHNRVELTRWVIDRGLTDELSGPR